MDNKNNRKQGGKVTAGKVVKAIFATIGRFIATCVMVGIITGCIVACVLVVYILNYIGADDEVDLDKEELGYSSTMLYLNKETQEYEELRKLSIPDNNRIWVDLNRISQYVREAVVATEDKRFEDHQGVDYRRSFGAFLGQFGIGSSKGGGSTITQQLIKNVTGDDDYRIDRKVREIFRALNLEKNYSKERILEAYLNVVPFGAGTNGIEMAALTYFGKSANDLTLAEAASIVGITQYPTYYNPFLYPDNNKERQAYVLQCMFEQEYISEAEYKAALNEELVFKREEYQQQLTEDNVMGYYEDYVFTTVVADLMEQYGWTKKHAQDMLYRSGWKIYTCVDVDIQNYLSDFYLTTEKFPTVTNAEYPQSSFNIIEPNGKLVATVGEIGEKTGSLTFSRATSATRHPGSSIKPLGVYALAFEQNLVHWSMLVDDSAYNKAGAGQVTGNWPVNHYGTYLGRITVAYAVQQSTNTIPVKLADRLTPRAVFDFMHDQLNMHNLVDSVVIDGVPHTDVDLAPLALGAMTNGVTNLEMVGGYQIYANGGAFTTPYPYTQVLDSEDRVILQRDISPRQVISEDTAVLVNKLLQTVNTDGTGTRARLDNMPSAGKTGTSDLDINQWYVGMSPYYVGAAWLGYDQEAKINEYGNVVPNTIYYRGVPYPPPILWKSVMQPIHEGLEYAQFPESENVESLQYCTLTGNLAREGCPVATGWYKKTFRPSTCAGHPVTNEGGEDGDADSGRPSNGSNSNSTGSNNPNNARREDDDRAPLRVYDDD